MNKITVSAVVDGNRTATLQIEAASAKILDTLGDAGRYAYFRWPIVVDEDIVAWDDLTTEQQLAVVYQEIIFLLREQAGTYHVSAARNVAGETAKAEKGNKYL